MNRMNQPPRHMPVLPGDEMFTQDWNPITDDQEEIDASFDKGGLPRMNVGENEIDPRERLKQRLLTSLNRRQSISMDPNLATQARDIQSGNNMAALGSEAASKFGLIGGKGPESILGKNMQAQNKVMDDRIGDMRNMDKMAASDEDRQIRLMQALMKVKEQRAAQNKLQFQKLDDGSVGSFNQEDGSLNILGKYPKPPAARDTTKVIGDELVRIDGETAQSMGRFGTPKPETGWGDKVDSQGNIYGVNPRLNKMNHIGQMEAPPSTPNPLGQVMIGDKGNDGRRPVINKATGKTERYVQDTPNEIPDKDRRDLEQLESVYANNQALLDALGPKGSKNERWLGWEEGLIPDKALDVGTRAFTNRNPAEELAFRKQLKEATQVFNLKMTGQAGSDRQYRQLEGILPNIGDHPETFRANSQRVIEGSQAAKERLLQKLEAQGYDVSKYRSAQPAVPQILSGGGPAPKPPVMPGGAGKPQAIQIRGISPEKLKSMNPALTDRDIQRVIQHSKNTGLPLDEAYYDMSKKRQKRVGGP